MNVRILAIFCVVLSFVGQLFAIAPDNVDYRRPDGSVAHVLDPGGMLSRSVRAEMEDSLARIRMASTAEVVVAIAPDLDGMAPQQWCERLFTRMKIGKEKEDNGLLIMISPGDRQAFIMPGYGMEGIFTDIACKKLAEQVIKPAMREGNLDGAVTGMVSAVNRVLSDPEVAAEIRSDQKENFNNGGVGALDSGVFLRFIRILACLAFLIAAWWCLRNFRRQRREPSNYEKSILWRKSIGLEIILTICSLGTGLVWLLLAVLMYRYWRTKRVICPTCGSKMRRLPENQDNEFLTPSQDFEERLNTVDWDVWKCDSCGTLERLPFRVPQKKYTECPSCHTVAMTLESDAVTRRATKYAEGEGMRTYVCKYCGHRTQKRYRIPRREDNSALAAAAIGAAAAAGRSRGGFGGGSGGSGGGFGGFGGFGGGATGGGGAGSSW